MNRAPAAIRAAGLEGAMGRPHSCLPSRAALTIASALAALSFASGAKEVQLAEDFCGEQEDTAHFVWLSLPVEGGQHICVPFCAATPEQFEAAGSRRAEACLVRYLSEQERQAHLVIVGDDGKLRSPYNVDVPR